MPELADLLRLERRADLPAIRPGDTVRVHVRVVEGNRERPQMFEGVVLDVKKPNAYDGCFRVRRIALASMRFRLAEHPWDFPWRVLPFVVSPPAARK